MIELELIRDHLRVDDEELSDALLEVYRDGAIATFQHRTGRVLVAGGLPEDAPPNALRLDAEITSAILMLIAHRDENRAATGQAALQTVPMGAQQIMDMHRWFYD